MHSPILTIVLAAGFICFVPPSPANAQVTPDLQADTSVVNPAFKNDAGPSIIIDTAHNNYHTADNRYLPFATLLGNDGYRVKGAAQIFTSATLKDVGVLVIANAMSNSKDITATESAFAREEIAAVRDWVEKGGSLLLITDHPPFAGAAMDMAAAFGFAVESGFVVRLPIKDEPDIFTAKAGTLKNDAVTRGRNASEKIATLTTFGGCAVQTPAKARPLITFPTGYMFMKLDPQTKKPVPSHPAGGAVQGAVMNYGAGRIAVFCEAGMFSAQTIPGTPPVAFGFNAAVAPENKQFILNLARWLAGVLP